jgi:hypothetical protein
MGVTPETATAESELEALVVDLSNTGSVVFVFSTGSSGSLTTHLRGRTRPVFRGPSGRRWWHVEHGAADSKWGLDVRLDQVEAVSFVRERNPFPHFPGEESLTVRFQAADRSVLYCYLEDLYDGERLRPERLAAWQRLRRHYGGRDHSTVENGSLRPAAVAA